MSAALTCENYPVSKRRTAAAGTSKTPHHEPANRGRVDLRADPEWLTRVEDHAARLGLNVSAYIRLAVSERMQRDDSEPRQKSGR